MEPPWRFPVFLRGRGHRGHGEGRGHRSNAPRRSHRRRRVGVVRGVAEVVLGRTAGRHGKIHGKNVGKSRKNPICSWEIPTFSGNSWKHMGTSSINGSL